MRTTSRTIFFLSALGQLILFSAIAQFNPERQALNKIKKGDWNSVIKSLNKSLLKDSLNVQATYVYSLLYFTPAYPEFNINRANDYKNRTIRAYLASDSRVKDRLKKFPLDSVVLSQLTRQIDSAAFEHAKRAGTENAYILFLKEYPNALQSPSAIELRDEAAFVTALKQNTHFAFRQFLIQYPDSHRAREAQVRFEKLLYDHVTRTKTLDAYVQFAEQYPGSPHAENAIQLIYDISTLDGNEENFENFVIQYPKSKKYKEASQILFHIKLAKQRPLQLDDSLKSIYPLRDWIPFYENSKWGFMDESGNEVFAASLDEIDPAYLCETLRTDFIKTNYGIIGRTGALICAGQFKQATDLGFGFVQAETDSTTLLIHKSGRSFNIPGLERAMVIGSQFLACQKANGWGLYSFTGQLLLPFSYERIVSRGRFIIFSKSGKEILVEVRNVVAYAQGKLDPIVADEIKRYGSKYFWIRNGALEKILDDRLNEVIPFDRQQITFSPAGLVIAKNKSYSLKDWPTLADVPLSSYEVYEPWLITRRASQKPALHFIPTREQVIAGADSIWFDETFAVVMKNDTATLMQSPSKLFNIPLEENYTIKKSRDSIAYILTKSRNRTSVYLATTFEKLLTTSWSSLEPVINNNFIIEEKGKYGLIDGKSKLLLHPEYDGILFVGKAFTLLKNRKFGIYNPIAKQLMRPVLDANPVPYNSTWAIGRKDNKSGFINLNNLTSKINYEFDEITFWKDSLALVKIGKAVSLYSIHNKKIMSDNLGVIQPVFDSGKERLLMFSQNSFVGVMGDRTGIILNPEFHELTFLRVNNELLFVGMKNINETNAEVYYMNATGKLLRKVVTNTDTAYSILCDN